MPATALMNIPLKRCFFFSSRRRHTRFDCDWSSDVCSSDLQQLVPNDRRAGVGCSFGIRPGQIAKAQFRSEERRVGKEWRTRWPLHAKKKKLYAGRTMAAMIPSSSNAHDLEPKTLPPKPTP